MRYLFLILMLPLINQISAQPSKKFRGTVTYQYSEFPTGSFPILLEKITFTKKGYYQQSLQMKFGIQLNDLFCDLEEGERFEVDHSMKTLTSLGAEPAAVVDLKELYALKDSVVKGEPCSVVRFSRTHAGKNSTEKIIYTYYLSEVKEIDNVETLATLQGNSNTKILDGRFKMIPVLITMEYESGKVLITEATEIIEGDFYPEKTFKDYKK